MAYNNILQESSSLKLLTSDFTCVSVSEFFFYQFPARNFDPLETMISGEMQALIGL